MIVTDEDDDTTTTFMTRTAYVRYHDITAWSLREGGGGKGRRTLPGDGSCLPPEFIVLRHVSSPFHPPIHPAFILLLRSLRATRLCLLFALSRFSCSLSLFSLSNPTHSPSSMPRCCTTPWFPLWLFSFTFSFLFSSHLFFFLRMALFLWVLYFLQLLLGSVKFFSLLRFSSHTVSTTLSKISSSLLRVSSFEENYFPSFSLPSIRFSFSLVLSRSRLTFIFLFRVNLFSLFNPSSFQMFERACAVDLYMCTSDLTKKITNEEQLSHVICTPSVFLLCSIFHLSKLIYTFYSIVGFLSFCSNYSLSNTYRRF